MKRQRQCGEEQKLFCKAKSETKDHMALRAAKEESGHWAALAEAWC